MPDWLTLSLVVGELIDKVTETAHLIFDGFPRNKSRLNCWIDYLSFINELI